MREGVQERDDTLENEVVLIRVLEGEDAQDVAEAERGVEAHLLLVLEQGGGEPLGKSLISPRPHPDPRLSA